MIFTATGRTRRTRFIWQLSFNHSNKAGFFQRKLMITIYLPWPIVTHQQSNTWNCMLTPLDSTSNICCHSPDQLLKKKQTQISMALISIAVKHKPEGNDDSFLQLHKTLFQVHSVFLHHTTCLPTNYSCLLESWK